ncbi:MAG: LacI family DNA-binding transcriptional regulator [Actinomycetes bacterium]
MSGDAVARVTLQTVADLVGVSRMTVSNAFSRPDQLSAALRERILDAARDLGYAAPDPAARMLAKGTTGAVGVLLTDSPVDAFSDEVATTFLGAVAAGLAPSGLALTLLSATSTEDLVPARDIPMDGAIVYSCIPDSSAVDWLVRRRLPLVYVDQARAPDITSVNVQDRSGARDAAAHLVELGHRRLAVFTSSVAGPFGVVGSPWARSDSYVASQRMRGWLDALTPAGIRPTVVRVPHGSDDRVYDEATQLLGTDPRPTAVLCFSDRMAHEVVRAAHDLGLDVPGDLSVVGFDDNPLSRRMRPALTTVRQDVQAKGHAASTALVRQIEQARTGLSVPPTHLRLPTELVVRDSTAAAPR